MKTRILFLAFLLCGGCKGISRVTNSEPDKKEEVRVLNVVACCQDNNAGILTYPAFLPENQVRLCESARQACHGEDCQIQGETYLPTDVDCGKYGTKIGDKYYVGKGY